MRRGGRLPERLTSRDLADGMKLTLAIHRDSLSLVVMFCNCQIVSKLPARHLCVVNHVCTSISGTCTCTQHTHALCNLYHTCTMHTHTHTHTHTRTHAPHTHPPTYTHTPSQLRVLRGCSAPPVISPLTTRSGRKRKLREEPTKPEVRIVVVPPVK